VKEVLTSGIDIKKNKNIIRSVDTLKEKTFEFVEENATDSPVENIKWYARETQTDQKLMHDVGKGDTATIRLFEFKFPPTLEKLPTKEEILTPQYLRELNIQLWGDDLRLIREPEVSITKEGCKVYAACQPRSGSNFIEEPKLLQEWMT
jgi:hypothetical protein